MASKVVPPDDPRPVSAVNWRHVRSCAGPQRGSGSDPEPAVQAQMENLRAQYEQQVRDARAAGRREGEAEGRSQAAAELQPVIQRLARTIDELGQLRARLRQEAESEMVKLSLAIARRVLRREIAIDPEALHGLILAALEKLQGQEISRVKVHPAHAGLVQGCLQKSVTGTTVAVLPDPACEVGAVVFETERGNLDASVESQLGEIERGLADCLRRHS